MNSKTSEQNELKRGIKGWQVGFIGLGGVIGSCYFLGIGNCLRDMGPAVVLAFGLVGVIVYGLMIAYSELLVNLPRKGSFIAYTHEFLGPTLSTGMGWSYWFNFVCYIPSEAIAVATVLTALMGTDNMATYVAIAIGAMLAITVINLCSVDIFAKIESGLAITKVVVIVLFIIVAFGIWVGLWGSNPAGTYEGFLAARVNFTAGEPILPQVFPFGLVVVIANMVNVIVTCQGTEIVGLTAAESQDPEHAIPKACKSVAIRIIALYIIPIIMLILIIPFGITSDAEPAFTTAAKFYNMDAMGFIFSAIVLVGAFSCANTSFYGTVRAMYGLSVEGLAPKFLGKITKEGNPRASVLWTLAFMWIILVLGLISEITGALESLYSCMLSLSGFTGTLAWVGINLSQIKFRKKLKQNGYDPETCLKAHVTRRQAWLPTFSVIMQIICLVMLAFGDLVIFIVACAVVFLPMIGYKIADSKGKIRKVDRNLQSNEKSFEETFPPVK